MHIEQNQARGWGGWWTAVLCGRSPPSFFPLPFFSFLFLFVCPLSLLLIYTRTYLYVSLSLFTFSPCKWDEIFVVTFLNKKWKRVNVFWNRQCDLSYWQSQKPGNTEFQHVVQIVLLYFPDTVNKENSNLCLLLFQCFSIIWQQMTKRVVVLVIFYSDLRRCSCWCY